MKHTILACCITLLFGGWTNAQPDPDVCIPGPGDTHGHPLPVLAEQFKVTVEARILNRNYSITLTEYYDYIENKGAAETNSTRFFYDYADKQYYTVRKDKEVEWLYSCTTRELTNHSFIAFGFKDGHIISAKDVFKFGEEFNETYMGQTHINSYKVDWWRTCIYEERSNHTFKMDFYFPADKMNNTLPTRIDINGTGPLHRNATDEPGRKWFNHIYLYQDIDIGPQPLDAFLPPVGVVCPGRVNHKELPKVPPHFSLTLEIIVPENKTVHYQKEYYHFDDKLVAYETLNSGWWWPYPVREVHDYNTGIAYRITPYGTCHVSPIPVRADDARSTDNVHVSMRVPSNFFALDATDVDWAYEGKTINRDTTLHVWGTKRLHWKPVKYRGNDSISVNSTWQYSFLDDGWTIDGHPSRRMGGEKLPTRLEIGWVAFDRQGDSKEYGKEIYNFFHPIERIVEQVYFDISQCYSHINESLRLAFNLEGKDTYKKYVVNNTRHFNFGVTKSIAEAIDVSPTRIANLKVVDGFKDLSTVFFTLLGRPQVQGNAINQTDPGPALTTAYKQLQLLVNSKEGSMLILEFIYHDEIVKVSAALNTLREETEPLVETKTVGLSTGVLSGVAIGTFILGAAIALLCVFIVYKKKQAEVPYSIHE